MTTIELIGNQPAQHDFLEDWEPGEVLYQGGFGSGKTWGAARKFLMLHAHNRCKGLVVAPTYPDISRLCIPELEEALNEWNWPYRTYTYGKGQHKFPHMEILGEMVYLISADDPSLITGFEVGHIWVEEGARIKQNTIDPKRDAITQIRSRLRNKSASILQMLISTTPEGTDTYVQRDFFAEPKENCRAYIGRTSDNKNLPPSYIEDLKATLPAHLLDQYLNGIAANLTQGIAHPTFDENNISESADFQNTVLHVGQDFNVQPMGWVALQEVGSRLHVVDEIFIDDFALVDDAMHAAKAKGWGNYQICFHPDKASKQRSTTGDSEFVTIQNLAREWGWNFYADSSGSNPPINNRVNNLSRLICNGVGERKLLVHPRCKHTIDDLRNTQRKKDGGYNPGTEGKRGHILDGLGYAAWDIAQPQGKPGIAKIA